MSKAKRLHCWLYHLLRKTDYKRELPWLGTRDPVSISALQSVHLDCAEDNCGYEIFLGM